MLSDTLEADPALAPIAGVADTLAALKETDSIKSAYASVGTTEFVLEGAKANVRGRETNLGRLVADSTVWGAQAYLDSQGINETVQIALKNGGGLRDTIVGPQIARIAIQKALAFNNKLAILRLTCPQLLAVFENAVSRALDADGRFPQVAGITVGYNPQKPGVEGQTELTEASRLTYLAVGDDVIVADGEVVGDADQTFVLATNSFLVTGADGYAALTEAESLGTTVSRTCCLQLLIRKESFSIS